MALQLPANFMRSYEQYPSYPENLTFKSTYIGGLRNYKTELDNVQDNLFTTKEANIVVPFRDLSAVGNGMAFALASTSHNTNIMQTSFDGKQQAMKN